MIGVYLYNRNSCFIDSLMMVLYFGFSYNIIQKIFYFGKIGDTRDPNYKKYINSYKSIHRQIIIDYTDLLRNNNRTSNKLRYLLGNIDSNISNGQQYNPSAVYAILADVFPDLQMDIPQIYLKSNKPSLTIHKRATLSILDYMLKKELDEPHILWSKIDSDIIVFQNDMAPPIKYINEVGLEFFNDIKVNKTKCLDYILDLTISDNKVKRSRRGNIYKLFGIILLHNVEFGSESGDHFTSIFTNNDDLWIGYDNAKPYSSIYHMNKTKVDNLIWKYNDQTKTLPYMFFYHKI